MDSTMLLVSIFLIMVISAAIDFPLILKIGQIEDETHDPANTRIVLLWAVAGLVVPIVVTAIVFKYLG